MGRGTLTDHWGNPYGYNHFRDLVATPAIRYFTDKLNEDFDLFSMGQDGISVDLVYVLGGVGSSSDDMVRWVMGLFSV